MWSSSSKVIFYKYHPETFEKRPKHTWKDSELNAALESAGAIAGVSGEFELHKGSGSLSLGTTFHLKY